MEFIDFNDKTHKEILNILIEHLNNLKEQARSNREQLKVDSRSMALRNRGKEINAALTATTDLFENLGIDVDEL